MMDNNQQVDCFSAELDALVERFRQEYDLNYASIIGTLHLKIHGLSADAYGLDDEDGETT